MASDVFTASILNVEIVLLLFTYFTFLFLEDYVVFHVLANSRKGQS
jgi:hypothetical protein